VILRRTAAHIPIYILFNYFERAVEELGLKAWLSLLKPGNEEYFRQRIKGRVYSVLEFKPWKQRREKILSEPEENLRWEPWDKPEDEIRAHYRLQAAIVATLMGDREELRTLAAELIAEPMNRKLEITYFLGNLTEGRVGLTYKELPTKSQILQWVHDIEQVQLVDRLSEIARLKLE